MSTSSESSILLIGLSGSGKTHFLVGLDVILDNQNDPNGLVHSDHAADRAYIQPLREQWLRGEELDHTTRQAPPPPHQLLVHHPATGMRTTFYVPDLAGESFDGQFQTRSFPHDFGFRVQQAAGVVLFMHCDHQGDHEFHTEPEFMDSKANAGVSATEKAPDWKIQDASKQVKLVDLLQFAAELRDRPLRVALAFSAWDLVEKAPKTLLPKDPTLFLWKRWPLLAQFLECNSKRFPFRTFGVSARGGGTSPEEVLRLTSMVHPRDRLIVVDDNHRSNDLTRPVRWLLGVLDNARTSNG